MEKKLDQTKKEYRKIIEKIIEQYENKLKKVENQFSIVMGKMIDIKDKKREEQKRENFLKSPSRSIPDLSNRKSISNKETEILKEKNQEMEKELKGKGEEISKIEKVIQEKMESIAEF